ncbi:MAG: hypothetical protein HOP15_00215 [Planctomycetes bacterium]|nr:hypothetical protein [Planctomycetota bacterium]
MNDACKLFRNEWLARAGAEREHARLCRECALWLQAAARRRSELSGLARLSAPAALDRRVDEELAGARTNRLERVLYSLARCGAPALLDERVAELFSRGSGGDEERGEQRAWAVRALEVQSAPDVLERLVSEELAAPERHLAERFPGSLERVAAPLALEQRLGSAARRSTLVRLARPLVALAAAGLVVWFAIGRGSEPRSRRFQVLHAVAFEDLDPMARSLAESLGGGRRR